MLKTYIVHYKPLIARREFMSRQLKHHKFENVKFYTEYDGNELTQEIVEKYYSTDFIIQKTKYDIWFPTNLPRILKPSDISVTIKYIKIYEEIANGTDDYALIMEDDSVLDKEFVPKFNKLFDETPKTFDMIFLGSGCDLHAENMKPGISVYRKSHPAARCVSATVVSKKACQNLLKTIIPFHLCIDWELNYQMYIHNMEVYWWEPPLVQQGSETGLFKTSMR